MTQPFIRADLTRKLTEAENNLIRDNYWLNPLTNTYNVGVIDNAQGTSTLIISYNIGSFDMDTMLRRDKDIATKAPSEVAVWRICDHLGLPYEFKHTPAVPVLLNGSRYYRVETLFQVEMACIRENQPAWNDPFHKVPEDIWLPCVMEFQDIGDVTARPIFHTDEDMEKVFHGIQRSIDTLKMLMAE